MFSGQPGLPASSGRAKMFARLESPYFETIFLGVLVVAGFLLRYFSISEYQVIAADGPSYIGIAKEILTNHTARGSIHYPPFYPFLIALCSFVINDFESAGVTVSLVMGSLLVIPVYLLAKAFFGRATAYAAAGIILVWHDFTFLSGVVLAISTYVTLLTTGLYFLWRSFSAQKYLPAIAAGVFLAAAYLTRQEAFISTAAICCCLSLVVLYEERSFKRIKPLAVAFCVFLALVFPYILMVHEIMGIWTLAGKSVVTIKDCLALYLNRPDLNRDPSFSNIGYLDLLRNYPGFLPYNVNKNLAALSTLFPVPMVIFALIGLYFAKRADSRDIQIFSVATLLPVIVLTALFLVSGTYVAPYVPVIAILCAYGLVRTEAFLAGKLVIESSSRKRIHWLTAVVIAAYVGNSVLHAIPGGPPLRYSHEMDGGRYDHKLVGKMIKKYLPEGSVIMTRSGRIGFYSDHPWVDIPQADMMTIVKTVMERKVRYLVADGQLLFQRPQLGVLLDPLLERDNSGLKTYESADWTLPGFYKRLVYSDTASQGVVVYEIKF